MIHNCVNCDSVMVCICLCNLNFYLIMTLGLILPYYSRKYWQELNLADWPQPALTQKLADLIWRTAQQAYVVRSVMI